MKRALHTITTGSITLGGMLGFGGEGEVYEVRERPDLVVKLYHNPPSLEKAEKLRLLARLGTERLLKIAAWPVDVALDAPDGKVVGFLMQRISQAEEVHTLHSPKSRLQKFPDASWAFLIYVAANIARAVSVVHQHGFVIGDMNPKNILVTRNATVYLLDCDSFQARADDKTYRCDAGFPEYTPPELQGAAFKEIDRRTEHDAFGLAIILFQLLFLGRHPYSGRYLGQGEMPLERAIGEGRYAFGEGAAAYRMQPPLGALPVTALPSSFSKLFSNAFLSAPAERPAPDQWIPQLESLAETLKTCTLHSGHLYSRTLEDCPWCEIESSARVRLFNFLAPSGEGRSAPFRLDLIWGEIEKIPPIPPMLLPEKAAFRALTQSEEARRIALDRRIRLALAIAFTAFSGILIACLGVYKGEPISPVILLILASLAACRIAHIDLAQLSQPQMLFQPQPLLTEDPYAEAIRRFQERTEASARRLEEKCDREAGSNRFQKEKNELESHRNDYINLQQTREQRLRQLDPEQTTHTDRIRLEKEIDRRRYRLEEELRRGAIHLQQLRHEILKQRSEIEPELVAARRSMAQAEIDLEAVARKNPVWPILGVLIFTFVLGLMLLATPRNTPSSSKIPETSQSSVPPPQESIRKILSTAPGPDVTEEAFRRAKEFYDKGKDKMEQGNYREAAPLFQNAIQIFPQLIDAQLQYSICLYHLERYAEAVDAAKEAIKQENSFATYYSLGLNYFELKQLASAKLAFQYALSYRDKFHWTPQYADVYVKMSQAEFELGEARKKIESLVEGIKVVPELTAERFELGVLYVLTDQFEKAKEQAEILSQLDSQIANDLKILIPSRRGTKIPLPPKLFASLH